MGDSAHLTRLAVIAFLVGLVLMVSVGAVAIVLRQDSVEENARSAASFALELRNSLVYGCEHEGNPLRRAVQKILREGIHNSAKVRASFFPNIPPAVLHRLIRAQVEANEGRLREIAPVECAAVYPPPPG